jgi:hypothetical protein
VPDPDLHGGAILHHEVSGHNPAAQKDFEGVPWPAKVVYIKGNKAFTKLKLEPFAGVAGFKEDIEAEETPFWVAARNALVEGELQTPPNSKRRTPNDER